MRTATVVAVIALLVSAGSQPALARRHPPSAKPAPVKTASIVDAAPLPAPAPAAADAVVVDVAAAPAPAADVAPPDQPLAEVSKRVVVADAGAPAPAPAPDGNAVEAADPLPPVNADTLAADAADAPASAPDAATPIKPRGILGPAFVIDLWQLAARGPPVEDAAAVGAPAADTTSPPAGWIATSTPADEEGGAPTVYLVPSGEPEEAGSAADAATTTIIPTDLATAIPSLAFEGGFIIDLPPLSTGGYGGGYGGDDAPTPVQTADEHADAWIKVLGGKGGVEVAVGGRS